MLEFSIVGGNDKGHFRMDESSGAISIENQLNREVQSEYDLIVRAKDKGVPALSSNATVHIILMDANNRRPEFDRLSYVASIREDADVGSLVRKVVARDADSGVNAIIEYSIVQGEI